MATIKQAQTPPANLKDMIPVSSTAPGNQFTAPPIGDENQTGLGQRSIGPIPNTLGTVYDTIRQWVRPSTPQNRIFPLPIKANIQAGAVAQSAVSSATVTPAASIAAALSWKGTWTSFTTYNKYDVVQFDISTYMALQTSTNVEPDTDTTNWVLVSKNINLKDYNAAICTTQFVQFATHSGTNTGTSKAFTSGNAAGNFIVVYVYLEKGSATPVDPGAIFTVSDSQGNTYNQISSTLFSWYSGATAAYDTAVYIAYNIKAGPNTVTVGVTGAASGATVLQISEYTGSPTVNPLVAFSNEAFITNPSPGTVTSINLTTTQANQIVLLYTAVGSGITPAGFTTRGTGYFEKTIATASTDLYSVSLSLAAQMWGIVVSNADAGSSSDTFYPSDVVIVNDVTYICIKKAAPGILITDTTYWAVLAEGGTGFTNPMTTLGDMIYEDVTLAAARLAGNITAVKQFLSQTGTGTVSAVPAWATLTEADITNLTSDLALKAPLASPALTGTPTAPTKSPGTNNTDIATTAYADAAVAAKVITSAIQFAIDGGGITPGTGVYGQISVPYNCTIVGWTITADQSGSAVIDILRSTYAAFPTTSSIAGSDKPTLSSVQKNTDATLTGWGSTALNAGDELQFNLNSITTCTRLNLTIKITIP